MPNRLADTLSPYLLQHASNPVDWYPWGDEAFEEAARRDVPVFLSIGYATCHWCHVMEHESFEDAEVAALMNEAFVSVKVDREERPDLDHAYMKVCQAIGRSCGWPLTVLLTPDRKPFFVGTYLPKEGRFGRPGMMDLIPRVQELWHSEREKVVASADQIAAAAAEDSAPVDGAMPRDGARREALAAAFRGLQRRFDATYGGFGGAPKFPSPHTLLFLLRYGQAFGESAATDMATGTLEGMIAGGIMDQVGFGFHRYSTDAAWRLPHFEKMLYDQALMLRALTEAWQATRQEHFRVAAEQTVEYVLRDLTSPEGAFYSGEDADSEGEEGLFYLWTEAELHDVLGAEDAAWARSHFQTSEAGNFLDEATRERTGRNVLDPVSLDADPERLARIQEVLLAARSRRERPLRDEKVLADWNGMMIEALALAGRAFERPEWVSAAGRAADFVLDDMAGEEGAVLHRWFRGSAGVQGMLDDYASLSAGLIELYQATLEPRWLDQATGLVDEARERFVRSDGAFFLTAETDEAPLGRQIAWFDGAIPSGNAVMLSNLLRLGHLTSRSDLLDAAERLMRAGFPLWSTAPDAVAAFLLGVLWEEAEPVELVVTGPDPAPLFRAADALYRPHLVRLRGGKFAPSSAAFAAEMGDGATQAFVCRGFACERPVDTAAALKSLLT